MEKQGYSFVKYICYSVKKGILFKVWGLQGNSVRDGELVKHLLQDDDGSMEESTADI